MLCSIIICCSGYLHLWCLDPMLGMVRPQDGDGGGNLQLWWVTAADNGQGVGLRFGANSLSLKKISLLQKFTMSHGYGRISK
jgi:hypothetical protein